MALSPASRALPLALLIAVAITGCAGDGSDLVARMAGGECGDTILDAGEECDDGNLLNGDGCDGSCRDETGTLAYIQATVFSPICAQCHRPGGIGPMPLDSEAASYQNLVGVRSLELPQLLRVEPGNAADSYLYWKIDPDPAQGRTIVGERMPRGLPPLDRDQIDSIVHWIDNGAEP